MIILWDNNQDSGGNKHRQKIQAIQLGLFLSPEKSPENTERTASTDVQPHLHKQLCTVSTLLDIQQATQNATLRQNEKKMIKERHASLHNVVVDRWSGF